MCFVSVIKRKQMATMVRHFQCESSLSLFFFFLCVCVFSAHLIFFLIANVRGMLYFSFIVEACYIKVNIHFPSLNP